MGGGLGGVTLGGRGGRTWVVQATVRAAWTRARRKLGNLMELVGMKGVGDAELLTCQGWSSISKRCIRGTSGVILSTVFYGVVQMNGGERPRCGLGCIYEGSGIFLLNR